MTKRVETTAWCLAVWAYRDQQVHRASGGYPLAARGSMTGLAMTSLALGITGNGGGGHAARVGVAPPEDALTVDAIVTAMSPDIRRELLAAARIGAMPDWNPRGLDCRLVPVLRGNGKPRMYYSQSGKRPIACKLELVGIEPQRAEAIRAEARERYDRVVSGLTELAIACSVSTRLKSWWCKGLGVEPAPWAAHCKRVDLTSAEKT